MHRIDTIDATSDNRFTEGNPTVPIAATTVSADWLNDVQEELVNVILEAKIDLQKGEQKQLLNAILYLINKGLAATETQFEAFRKALIGSPLPLAGGVLPSAAWVWANGDEVLKGDYPEFDAEVEKGRILTITEEVYNTNKQAMPGAWVIRSNGLGYFTPRLEGLFARYCGGEVDAGKYAPDMGRQLSGYADLTVTADVSGAFAPTGIAEGVVYADPPIGEPNRYSAFMLDASLVWGAEHSGVEFTPAHYKQSVALYLGRAAQV